MVSGLKELWFSIRFDRWARFLSGDEPDAAKASRRIDPVRDFRAVEIVACARSCASVQEWNGATFLWRQAPRLPLHDCSFGAACNCSYLKHSDRRQREDRRRAPLAFGYAERRSRMDRRRLAL
jgi:hypothetical protein